MVMPHQNCYAILQALSLNTLLAPASTKTSLHDMTLNFIMCDVPVAYGYTGWARTAVQHTEVRNVAVSVALNLCAPLRLAVPCASALQDQNGRCRYAFAHP